MWFTSRRDRRGAREAEKDVCRRADKCGLQVELGKDKLAGSPARDTGGVHVSVPCQTYGPETSEEAGTVGSAPNLKNTSATQKYVGDNRTV